MNVGRVCRREVATVSGAAEIAEAARLMLDQHVTFVVVYADGDESRRPIGVLTDRDIVRQRVCKEGSAMPTVCDVMTREPLIACERDQLRDVLWVMQLTGVRRVPVIDARGGLSGLLALDDAIIHTLAWAAKLGEREGPDSRATQQCA